MASPTESAASFRTAQEGSPKEEPEAPKVEASIDVKLEDSKTSKDSKDSKDGLDDHEQDAGMPSPYRPVRDIPYQLRDHIRVFLEEKMCKSYCALQIISFFVQPPPLTIQTARPSNS